MSGPLWVRSGRSWCKQDHAAPKEMFQIPAAGWRGRSLFILQTAITKAELHPVTSFGRLGRRECLHRAVKTRRCECPSRCDTQDARRRSGELLCFLNTSREISWEKRPVQCARDGFVCPPDCVGFSHGCSTTAGLCFPLGRE